LTILATYIYNDRKELDMTTKMENSERFRVITSVVRNQSPVPSELLELYEGEDDLLLVGIIAKAQGVKTNSPGFYDFITGNKEKWVEWALTAKAFRKWLNTSGYSYEFTPAERLAELFFEHLESEGGCL